MNTQERIKARVAVSPSGCWEWRGAKNGSGYGVISVDGKQRQAHRAAFEAFVGPIRPAMCVLHKCHVRACVNPEHLYEGTKIQNSQDAVAAGTHGKRGPYFDGYTERHKALRRRQKARGDKRFEFTLTASQSLKLDLLASEAGKPRSTVIAELIEGAK